MNLLASFQKSSRCHANIMAAAVTLATLIAAQWPLRARAADAVLVGSNITFIATADGTPAPTFQWRKNGTAIAGATAATLSLSGVTTSDAATYQVVASNELGSTISPDEVLVVETGPTEGTNIPPAIATQPAPSQTVASGGSVSFSVSATGTPTPTFQWQKNGVAIGGATNTTLSLSGLTLNDSGTYLAVATNAAGSVSSNPAVLTVTDPSAPPPPPPANIAPTILAQPSANQTAAVGGSATFTVSAAGVPAPTFQWKKNGGAISGATQASLTLTFLTMADSGTYTVVASNSVGSVTSSDALLAVTDAKTPTPPLPPTTGTGTAPVITSQPASSQTVQAGSSVSFTVVAVGTPSPSYQWRKNGAKIAGATNATFALSAASSADAGTYTVIASNSAGTVSSESSSLFVHSIPKFTVQPTPQAVTLGSSTKFSVGVSAIPGASLQWHKDGSPIPGATSSLLMVNSATAADVGVYSVVATNELGTSASKEAALVIAVPPIITGQPASQIVWAKSNVTLTASASGSPAPTFQWKKNGANIPGETRATLEIKGVTRGDAGEYSVEARNVAGWTASKRVTLAVNNLPGRLPADEIDPNPGVGEVAASGLVNLSVRANSGTGSDGLIVGFVINGTAGKSVLVRGVGPTLRDFGVSGALADPQLSLYSGSTMTASNDDWNVGENADQIAGTSIRVGAFSLADKTSDSALMASLQNGAYTVQLSGKNATNGVALVEVYDAATAGAGKLVNLSVRAYVGTGSDAPNVGFVVAGTAPRKIMIRAVGPTLSGFGVTDSIADPQLELFRGSARIDQNDNWGGNTVLSSTFAEVGAFGFADAESRDAVLLTTLEPGAYTVVVSGANGTKGVGLVEVYDVP